MLPISSYLPSIIRRIQTHKHVLLEATPGSGKTTLVPLELLKHYSGIILVLEPRRLATKMAAARVASLLKEEIGQTVGYLYRHEKKIGLDTRLIFLTEGSFIRYLQSNPTLKGVDVVVLDEFHERHLATDLAWGLLHTLSLPPHLVIMSATLDESPLRKFLPYLEKIQIEAPIHPLQIRYADNDVEWLKRTLERKVLWGIQEATRLEGDILVFLPGLGEIKKIHEQLNQRIGHEDILLLTLHGQESSPENLIMQAQNQRRIILASNVAESSLTIPGVKIVVDAGLQREAIYSNWSGIAELITSNCSQASAIQRAGRAARTGPGVCIRLYTEADFNSRDSFSTPEVLKTDLSSVILDLGHWSIDPEQFPWPSPPEQSAWKSAKELLYGLGALDKNRLSPIGREMAKLPLPVRASRAFVETQKLASQETLRDMSQLLSQWLEKGEEARRLRDRLNQYKAFGSEIHAEKLLIKGFPDRICRVRGDDVVTVTGETWKLGHEVKKSWDQRKLWGLVLDVHGTSQFVTRLIPLELDWITPLGIWETSHFFEPTKQKMIKRSTLRLGSLPLVIKDESTNDTNLNNSNDLLIKATKHWLKDFFESPLYRRWELFGETLYPNLALKDFEWDLFTEEFLLDFTLPDDQTKATYLNKLQDELQLYFDPSFQNRLKDKIPTHFSLHPNKNCEIIYEQGKPPAIEAFIQDFYGWNKQPSLLDEKIPLTVRLCGPHRRPEQITGDLVGFWKNTYVALSRELKRDYPRHYWPEDPSKAEPKVHTNPRVKK